MTKLITTSLLSLLAAVSANAAAVSLSTTSTGSRVVSTTTPLTPVTGGFQLGTMTSESDFATFTVFGTGTLGTNSAFPTGGVPNGTATNNATATDFAGKAVYIVFYSGATLAGSPFAGIYKSTELYAADLNNSPSQTKNLTVANFTTAINPTTNWLFEPATVNPTGTTGAAGTPPTNRTGIVFDLGAPVPEPSGAMLLSFIAIGGLIRRRR